MTTRGDFAQALYQTIGVTSPSSTGTFADAGTYDGAASTLADLGVTNGVGAGQFGTTQTISRGEAFTMMARLLGLAPAGASIQQAAQALVNAGIVKGYADGNLGLSDQLLPDHLNMLMGRLNTELDRADPSTGLTRREGLLDQVSGAKDATAARENPAWAAFLQAQGLAGSQIDDEIALRQSLFQEDARRRSEAYARATDRAIEGTQMDFENRGLFRSGTRLNREAKTRERIGFDLEQEQYTAQRAQEELQRLLEQQRSGLSRETAAMRLQMATEAAANEIATGATSTSPAPSYSSPAPTQPSTYPSPQQQKTSTTKKTGFGAAGANYR
jgi:hypothetical protein